MCYLSKLSTPRQLVFHSRHLGCVGLITDLENGTWRTWACLTDGCSSINPALLTYKRNPSSAMDGKIKTIPVPSWRHRRVEVLFHLFLTSTLEGNKWSASRPGRYAPRNRLSVNHWRQESGSQTRSGRFEERRSLLILLGIEPKMHRLSTLWPLTMQTESCWLLHGQK